MFAFIRAWWTATKYAVRFNRWPVQTEEEAIEDARKRLMELLYPDNSEHHK